MTRRLGCLVVLVGLWTDAACKVLPAARARPAQQRAHALPVIVSRLRGGSTTEPLLIRVRSRDGMKRVTVPSGDTTLAELRKILQKDHRVPKDQRLARAAGGAQSFKDEEQLHTLHELGITHGSVLHLHSESPARPSESTPAQKPATRTARSGSRRRRRTTMADFEAERAEFEVVLEAPKEAECKFVSTEVMNARRFSDFLVDLEFEEPRFALLFGRWDSAPDSRTGVEPKTGVQVDLVYEPPQMPNPQRPMQVQKGPDAAKEVKRAREIATCLGMRLVGIAYAHPPRFHVMETAELRAIVKWRKVAIKADAEAARLFIAMRFRPVYEDEDIDADVTAEVYQPTEQFASLVEKGVVVDAGVVDGGGHAGLTVNSSLEFKFGPDILKTADLTYFFARVRCLPRM